MVSNGTARSPPVPERFSVGGEANMDEHLAGSVGMNRHLRVMRALGYRFGTSSDDTGLVVALVGARVHHGVIDIVQFYGEHDADATRISCTERASCSRGWSSGVPVDQATRWLTRCWG